MHWTTPTTRRPSSRPFRRSGRLTSLRHWTTTLPGLPPTIAAMQRVVAVVPDPSAAGDVSSRASWSGKDKGRLSMQRIYLIALTVLMLSLPIPALAQSATPAASSPSAARGRLRRPRRIGGRSLYLECRGTGGPTVVLVAGYRASARYWRDDLLQAGRPAEDGPARGGRDHPRLRLRLPGDLSRASARTTSSAAAIPSLSPVPPRRW